MPKNLEQMLLELNSDKPSRSKNRGAFLKCWPEIKELLERGWTFKSISQALRENGCVTIGYEGLRKLVARQRELESRS